MGSKTFIVEVSQFLLNGLLPINTRQDPRINKHGLFPIWENGNCFDHSNKKRRLKASLLEWKSWREWSQITAKLLFCNRVPFRAKCQPRPRPRQLFDLFNLSTNLKTASCMHFLSHACSTDLLLLLACLVAFCAVKRSKKEMWLSNWPWPWANGPAVQKPSSQKSNEQLLKKTFFTITFFRGVW